MPPLLDKAVRSILLLAATLFLTIDNVSPGPATHFLTAAGVTGADLLLKSISRRTIHSPRATHPTLGTYRGDWG